MKHPFKFFKVVTRYENKNLWIVLYGLFPDRSYACLPYFPSHLNFDTYGCNYFYTVPNCLCATTEMYSYVKYYFFINPLYYRSN